MLTRATAAAALVCLALVGCGDDGPTAAEEAEAGIAAAVTERLATGGAPPPAVVATCPEDLAVDPGATFRCQVAVGEADPVDVALAVDEEGAVELQHAVIPTAAAEAYLADELAVAAEGPVSPDCGDAPLLVADVGDELRCEVVRQSDGAVRTVVVTVLSTDGTVRYVVAPPPTG